MLRAELRAFAAGWRDRLRHPRRKRIRVPVGQSGAAKIASMRRAGFQLMLVEESTGVRAADYVFLRPSDFAGDEEGRLLLRAGELARFRAPEPEPGWRFDIDWDNPDPAHCERRTIWQHFREANRLGLLETEWVNGIRLISYLGNDLSKQLFISGRFEPNELSLLGRVLRPGMMFVDAGANEGLFTLFAASLVGDAGTVLAFEPSPREFGRLERNCGLNEFSAIRLFPLALSDCAGEADLGIAIGEHAGQNLLGAAPAGVEILRRMPVRTTRFDDVPGVSELPRLDLFKIDVEGEEYRLLRGAERSIRRHRPVILFECSEELLRGRGSSAAEVQGMLREWGYEIFAFDPKTGEPAPLRDGMDTLNLIAALGGRGL